MQPLPIDDGVVADCRARAAHVAAGMQSFIDAHTTVSIERTVLRAYGIDGADGNGTPLVNTCVDRVLSSGQLGRGIATALGAAILRGATPQEAAEELAYGSAPSTPTPSEPELRLALQPHTDAAIARIDGARAQREAARSRLGVGPTPWKYVIVATGNIYDDADQARAAAQAGADIIAVIRSTAQSLIDYVPYGATTEGFGGTWATQENFRVVRAALDDEQEKLGRYLCQVNYSSGLCMPEIAYLAAIERLDMVLNDAMYGILFRDINPRRTLCDQYFSRLCTTRAGIIINTGEDNYLTTADAVDKAHTVLASQFINEAFAHSAGMPDSLMGLGHAFEIDKSVEDSLLLELAQAQLVRQIFPRHPIKWMPATKHKTGDIFWSHRIDGLFDLVGVATGQTIELLGMMTESVHTPLLQDRFVAIKGADYVFHAARHLGDELRWNPDGKIVARANEVLKEAHTLLGEVAAEGMFSAIARGAFADVKRPETGGRGLVGVIDKSPDYLNPILNALQSSK